MSQSIAVLSVGRVYADLIFTDLPRMPSLGTEVFAGGLDISAGGGAFITAAYLKAAGCASNLAAVLPAPPFAEGVRADIAAAGVDAGLSRPADPALDPQATVALVGQSDRAFLTRRTGPAVPDLDAGEIRALGIRHLHIGELTTLVERPDLIRLARDLGLTLSLDCAWDDQTGKTAGDLIREVDVFLPNEEEAAALASLGLSQPFAPLTVIKQGANGAEAIRDGASVKAQASSVQAVDTTGAGDAFNAGFLTRWLAGADLQTCLAFGNLLGGAATTGPGGFAPDRVRDSSVLA